MYSKYWKKETTSQEYIQSWALLKKNKNVRNWRATYHREIVKEKCPTEQRPGLDIFLWFEFEIFSDMFQSLHSTFNPVSIGKGLSSPPPCSLFRGGTTPNPIEEGTAGERKGNHVEELRARDGEERKQRLWRRETLWDPFLGFYLLISLYHIICICWVSISSLIKCIYLFRKSLFSTNISEHPFLEV